MKKRFSIVTCCRSRLQHLKQSLPTMIAQGAHEVIVVDYGCPEGTAEWVEAHYPSVKVVWATDSLGYNASRAKNLGIAAAESEWICAIDADGLPLPGWLSWLDYNIAGGNYAVIANVSKQPESCGVVVFRRSDFELAGGYDEAIRGWGGDDVDLFSRFRALGLKRVGFPNELLGVISHGHEIRDMAGGLQFLQGKLCARLYLRAKEGVSIDHGHMDVCCRSALLTQIVDWVREISPEDEASLFPFRFTRFCKDCAMRHGTNYQLVMTVQRRMLIGPRRPVVKQTFRPYHHYK